jgi:hypothetical protein
MEWNITAKCECKPNQPVWVLTDLSVDFHAHERFLPIPNNYTPEHNAFAQQCEKEHADDFNKWGNTEGSKLVDEVKKNRANISYFGKDKEQQCEDDARKELDAKLKLSASQADRRSITRWDTPKYHTWNDKTNSPARNRPANYPN